MKSSKKYSSPGAMRTALEERINSTARETNQDIQRLRRQVAFDRLLARLFSGQNAGRFVLKGGYALELRLHKSRTTKDIDICVNDPKGLKTDNKDSLLLFIQRAAAIDLGDFFEYGIGESILDLENALYGGYRFPVECRMAGRRFAHFNIDIAAGDVWLDTHEELAGNQWLDFAGITSPKIPAISAEQQFAEKIHSYSLPRQTPNSRAKDLVDLVLIIEECNLNVALARDALSKTFKRRKTHEIPVELANPPETWRARFRYLAQECGIPDDIDSAIIIVRNFYITLMGGRNATVSMGTFK
jgi:predicted nucleotidyltransferase component of viral defense system